MTKCNVVTYLNKRASEINVRICELCNFTVGLILEMVLFQKNKF